MTYWIAGIVGDKIVMAADSCASRRLGGITKDTGAIERMFGSEKLFFRRENIAYNCIGICTSGLADVTLVSSSQALLPSGYFFGDQTHILHISDVINDFLDSINYTPVSADIIVKNLLTFIDKHYSNEYVFANRRIEPANEFLKRNTNFCVGYVRADGNKSLASWNSGQSRILVRDYFEASFSYACKQAAVDEQIELNPNCGLTHASTFQKVLKTINPGNFQAALNYYLYLSKGVFKNLNFSVSISGHVDQIIMSTGRIHANIGPKSRTRSGEFYTAFREDIDYDPMPNFGYH